MGGEISVLPPESRPRILVAAASVSLRWLAEERDTE